MERMLAMLLVTLLSLPQLGSGFEPIYERAPIHYFEQEPDTQVTRLMERAASEGFLNKGTDREILLDFLERLQVPIESQVLVFSKTSAQNSRISPKTPRAIYYSDDVYVGWVQGGEIEVASFDERLGIVFHLIRLTHRESGKPPLMARDRSCLNCHAGSANGGLPGVMVRSVYPQESGMPLFQAGSFHTRHDSPIEERWGGWYVTGEVEESHHLGNAVAEADRHAIEVVMHPLAEASLGTLDALFDAHPYPNGGQSDVVSLMVLEHQVGVHNILVEANLTTQNALHRHVEMQKAFGEPVDAPLSDTNERILTRMADKVLQQMLFVEEVELPAGVEGSITFQDAFQRNAREGRDGRSLKDFRLYERLMKYRCSHLIYSEAFEHLPSEIRDRILVQLYGILNDPDQWPEYRHLSESEREHIFEILSETLPDLPEVWKR
ncbi:MAG: hypothetical protein AAGA96_03275 [Verrucomicrobiota bacterium]